jgi:hypothetical protein
MLGSFLNFRSWGRILRKIIPICINVTIIGSRGGLATTKFIYGHKRIEPFQTHRVEGASSDDTKILSPSLEACDKDQVPGLGNPFRN